MRIAVDAGCLGIADQRLRVGVYTVVKNLLFELGKLDKENHYLLYSFYPIDTSLLQQFGQHMKNIVVKPAKGWLKIALPLRLLRDKPDILLATSQAMPLKLPFTRYKTVGMFYDIAFEKYPDLFSYAANVEKHKKNSKDLAKKAHLIISVSRATKNDLVDIYHVSPKKIIVAYPGFGNDSSASNNDEEINPYFLFVGAFKKSKNIPLLIQAFGEFLKETKKANDLLLVGSDTWMDPDITITYNTLPEKTRKRIKMLGFVDEATKRKLFQHAIAFASPSLYEGFGLPFLEAQNFGCPVIGSTRGSLPEVIGTSGILVDPTSIRQLANAMRKVAEDNTFRLQLIKKGYNNSKKYSWKAFAKKIQSAIESLQ